MLDMEDTRAQKTNQIPVCLDGSNAKTQQK